VIIYNTLQGRPMANAITDVPGIKVGHAQDIEGGTGCTVIICEKGAVTGVDVRGSAPATRELALLDPVNKIEKAHAIYLGGGSAYGLDGAGGVMQYLEEHKIGFDTFAGILVPIVPGAALYDLPFGKVDVRPDKKMGYAACENASEDNREQGNVGAGTAATVGKLVGPFSMMKGGLGTASYTSGDLVIGALVVVNCVGDVLDSKGNIIAGALNKQRNGFADTMKVLSSQPAKIKELFAENTTLGVIATNARLTKSSATKVAMASHDGYARAINPVHTMEDGDIIFCMSTGDVDINLTTLGAIAAQVMAQAIENAVKSADSLYGIPGYKEIANIK